MRKSFVLIACLALTLSLRAGDFKRFYAANAGERIVSLTALPGGGLWLKSQMEKGGGEVNRVLVPSLHRVYRIPDGLTPLAAAAESGILIQQRETLYFRSLVKSEIFFRYDSRKAFAKVITFSTKLLYLYSDDVEGNGHQTTITPEGLGASVRCTRDGNNPCHPEPIALDRKSPQGFMLSDHGDFVFRKAGNNDVLYLEPAASDKTLIEWGKTSEIGWVVTSASRNVPLAPPRRIIKIFSATDGTQLANTQIAKEAPAKGLAVAFKINPNAPDALAVITGGGMQWWAPKAEHIDDLGEVTLDLATAIPAE